MAREDVVNEFVKQLKNMKTTKLGVVQRDPIIISELPKTGFPAVYVETVDEDRENLTMGATRLMRSIMQINCVIVVAGKERDRQRNIVVDHIEEHIAQDKTLGGHAKDCNLTRIELVELGETEPYASCRAIFTVEYCFNI
jgi:hypothetical protein|tara:strand:+ start:1487 stop:1906 length:420 start_codon:yes stop_codon:yes gene_type:complete